MRNIFLFLFMVIFTLACEKASNQSAEDLGGKTMGVSEYLRGFNTDTLEVATFSGGHFYGLEAVFGQLKGTEKVLSGYTGGSGRFPNFEVVNSGQTKHKMAVQVYYNPKKISYQMLLAVYFVAHDPTNKELQGIEKGPQFAPFIFYHNDEQRQLAEKELDKVKSKRKYQGKTIYTDLQAYDQFWVAEEEHQNYAKNNIQEDYVQGVLKPYLRRVEKGYGAWMLRSKADFPVARKNVTKSSSN